MKSYKCKVGSFSSIDLVREGLQSKKKKSLTNSITAEEIKWQQGAGEKKESGSEGLQCAAHLRQMDYFLTQQGGEKRKDSDE